MIKAGIEVGDEKNKIDPLYYINVYKLVRFTDADDDVELESKDILFRLGMVALPSEEGYRLAPATFAVQLPKPDERERALQLDYFLNTLTLAATQLKLPITIQRKGCLIGRTFEIPRVPP